MQTTTQSVSGYYLLSQMPPIMVPRSSSCTKHMFDLTPTTKFETRLTLNAYSSFSSTTTAVSWYVQTRISTLGCPLQKAGKWLLPWTVQAGRPLSSLYDDWWTNERQWPIPSCNLLLVASIIYADYSNKKINNYYRPIYRQSIKSTQWLIDN